MYRNFQILLLSQDRKINQGRRYRGAKEAEFSKSVNPIQTEGRQIMPYNTNPPPPGFPHLPTGQ